MKAFVQKRTHQLVLDPGATPAIGFPDGFVHKITVDSSPVKLKIQAQADTAQIDHHAVSSIIMSKEKATEAGVGDGMITTVGFPPSGLINNIAVADSLVKFENRIKQKSSYHRFKKPVKNLPSQYSPGGFCFACSDQSINSIIFLISA